MFKTQNKLLYKAAVCLGHWYFGHLNLFRAFRVDRGLRMSAKLRCTCQTSAKRLVARDYYVSGAPALRHSLHPGPSQNRTSSFPTSGSSVCHSVRLRPYPCQIRCHCFSTPCIVPVFLLSRSTNRGDLRSAGISRLFATPLRLTGPHHSRRGHLTPSFYIGRDTRVLPLRSIPQEHLDRRSPGCLPVVGLLDAVLDPGVPASRSSVSRSPLGLRPYREDRLFPKIHSSRGYVSDSGLHPSPRCPRASPCSVSALGFHTTERLTRPYSGGLPRLKRVPSQQAIIARLPDIRISDFRVSGKWVKYGALSPDIKLSL